MTSVVALAVGSFLGIMMWAFLVQYWISALVSFRVRRKIRRASHRLLEQFVVEFDMQRRSVL